MVRRPVVGKARKAQVEYRCRLERLEDRLAPAVAIWDGGGADNKWTTAANWAGDVAPSPGDDLVFPSAAQPVNVNDFPARTSFGHLALNGFNYQISGNAIVLTNGLSADTGAGLSSDVPPRLDLEVAFTRAQTVTANSAFTLAGRVDLDFIAANLNLANDATVTVAGNVVGAGGLTKTGGGPLFFTGNNTYTGVTLIEAGIVYFNGIQAGSILAHGGTTSGAGTVAALTATNGGMIQPGDGATLILPPGHRLTTGDLKVEHGGAGAIGPAGVLNILIRTFTSDASTAHDQFVVHGSVQLGGQLRLSTISFSHGGPLGDGTITIIDNDGSDPVGGTFAGLPEGAVINNVNEKAVRVSYKGGDGNDVTLTTVDPATVPRFAVGAGAGGGPQVNVYAVKNDDPNAPGTSAVRLRAFNAYEPSFRGGVRVATGDLSGDGIIDVVTAPGPGRGPLIRVWNGAAGALVREFNAYDPNFRGGVFVAVADVNGDGTPDIITGAGAGGGPHVKVFDGKTGAVLDSFLAYDPSFTGGVTVTGADIYGDKRAVVITGAGRGGGPHVKVFDANNNNTLLRSFFAYEPSFRGGITVAAGDTDGDGVPDVITGPGPGMAPRVRSFAGLTGAPLRDYMAYYPAFTGGVTVVAVTLSGRGVDIVTGPGPGGGPHVTDLGAINFLAFDPAFTGGVFVG